MKQIVLTLILTIIGSIALFPKHNQEIETYDYRNQVETYTIYVDGPYNKAGNITFYQELTIGDVLNYLGRPNEPIDLTHVDLTKKIYDNMIIHIPLKNSTTKNELININTILEEDLINTKLFSETISKAIISYRNEVGFFKSVDDLINVKGIGEKTLEKVRPFIKVS